MKNYLKKLTERGLTTNKTGYEFSLRTSQIAKKFDYLRSDFERINKFCEANIS